VRGLGFSQRLELRQAQTLVMTPQLQQAIKMLQLSNLELGEFVAAEIERNPLLERQDRSGMEGAPLGDAGEVEAAVPQALPEALSSDVTAETAEHWRVAAGSEGDGSIDLGGDWPGWRGRGGGFEPDDHRVPDHSVTRPKTLRDHLLEQIGADFPAQGDRLIAVHLLDLLDEAGYLRGELASVAEQLGGDLAAIEAVLLRLQQLDPPGVFARDLRECLLIQLRECNRLDPAMAALLDNLPLLAARNMGALVKACGVDAADLAEMIAEIKSLDPRPGLAFDPPLAQPVVPDILLRPGQRAGWVVELNPETLPRVLVNFRYYSQVSRAARSKIERDYLAEQLQAANWLVKALHQRATTILKVASELVRQQDAFLRHGVRSLRPLVLRDIADAVGVHESTVSRVTTNKYLATPRGLYELKYFFSSSIPAARGGDAHSAEAVRHRIRGLIDAEGAGDPLSDERIVELLQQEGVNIARRTVAKYREAMRIPSSAQRRRERLFALAGGR
jgi:RNA polymerase sigma-54 factor